MQTIKIEDRREYELYVKNAVSKMQVSGKHKSNFRKIAMQCFDDGNKFSQGNLSIEIGL